MIWKKRACERFSNLTATQVRYSENLVSLTSNSMALKLPPQVQHTVCVLRTFNGHRRSLPSSRARIFDRKILGSSYASLLQVNKPVWRNLSSDEVRIRKDGSFEVKSEVCTRRELNPFCELGARDAEPIFNSNLTIFKRMRSIIRWDINDRLILFSLNPYASSLCRRTLQFVMALRLAKDQLPNSVNSSFPQFDYQHCKY